MRVFLIQKVTLRENREEILSEFQVASGRANGTISSKPTTRMVALPIQCATGH